MAFLGCPNCKFVWVQWNENNEMGAIYTNSVIRQKALYGLACPMCFAEMKVIFQDTPKLCKHSRPIDCRCIECRKLENDIDDKIRELKELKNNHGRHN